MRNKVSYPSWGRLGQPLGSEKRSRLLTVTSDLLWVSRSFSATPQLSFAPSRCSPTQRDHCICQGELFCLVSVVMV